MRQDKGDIVLFDKAVKIIDYWKGMDKNNRNAIFLREAFVVLFKDQPGFDANKFRKSCGIY